MALTVKLDFLSQPAPDDVVAFALLLNGDVVADVSFAYGTDVTIGATLQDTATATAQYLSDTYINAGITYNLGDNEIEIEFEGFGATTVTGGSGIAGVLEITVAEAPGLIPFNLLDLSIEIIDTYENERVLEENFTKKASPVLSYDSGDDLYQTMMPSKLTFNLLDETAADGRFLHLLTGDEQRFKVKVRNTDAEGVQTLLWQGFILPDLYSEPYKNGVFFVEFTAIDMLASLKGKEFPLWYYYQKIEIIKLLGYIMQYTGLLQEFYVKPSLVNVSMAEGYEWRKMNANLRPFLEDKKQMQLYDLLDKLLTAQGMQIMSWRGKWILQGITRRGEASGEVEVYHPDGSFKEIATLENTVVAPLFSADLPVVTAETPWKKVNFNFNTESEPNLFSESVVEKEFYSTSYDYAEDLDDLSVGYSTAYMDNWQKVGANVCMMSTNQQPRFYYNRNTTLPAANYNVTESAAMVNYFECREKPFAVAGRRYELEIEVSVTHIHDTLHNSQWIEDHLRDGYYNKILCFQVFLDGVEILSNRPSFPTSGILQFKKTKGMENAAGFEAMYRLKWEFDIPVSGNITFRFLPPLDKILDYNILNFYINPEVLRINVVGELEDIESVSAVRDINFTKEHDIDADFTTTVDDSVENSFGIGLPLSARFAQLHAGTATPIVQLHTFMISGVPFPILLELRRFVISELSQTIIFRADNVHSVFLRKADGTEIPYHALYTKTILGVHYAAVYTGFTAAGGGKPKLPPDYYAMPVPEVGDTIMIMLSLYPVENKNNRALWKIHGFGDATARTYAETLAYACHAVRPDTCFSLDTNALACVWPLQRVQFNYQGERMYLPTRLEINLTEAQTQLKLQEVKLSELNDIEYE